ncbi:MAG: hypothetical protein K8R67_17285 [Desulfobacteraceae bacterium]|nr:hypothetical protein [Desulfobacteraceae bacterium]
MDKEKTKDVIVIAIKPVYAHAILFGKKAVEFRKNGVPTDIKNIVLYSTKPDQEIMGYCSVVKCIIEPPEILWKKYGDVGGIKYTDFSRYYKDTTIGKCYVIGDIFPFTQPISLAKCKSFSKAPQSFTYLNKAEWKNFKRKKLKESIDRWRYL